MVTSCSALHCKNRWLTGVRLFHRFPLQNLPLLQKWLRAIKRPDWIPSKFSFICSDHFKPEDYIIGKAAKCKLKTHAVPSIFKEDDSLGSTNSDKSMVPRLSRGRKPVVNMIPSSSLKVTADATVQAVPSILKRQVYVNMVKKNELTDKVVPSMSTSVIDNANGDADSSRCLQSIENTKKGADPDSMDTETITLDDSEGQLHLNKATKEAVQPVRKPEQDIMIWIGDKCLQNISKTSQNHNVPMKLIRTPGTRNITVVKNTTSHRQPARKEQDKPPPLVFIPNAKDGLISSSSVRNISDAVKSAQTHLSTNAKMPKHDYHCLVTNLKAMQSKLSMTREQLQATNKKYRLSTRSLQAKLSRLTKKASKMAEELKSLREQLKQKPKDSELLDLITSEFEGSPILPILIDEVKNLKISKLRRSYSSKVKEFAVTSYLYSHNGYSFLRKYLTLPSIKMIQKMITVPKEPISSPEEEEVVTPSASTQSTRTISSEIERAVETIQSVENLDHQYGISVMEPAPRENAQSKETSVKYEVVEIEPGPSENEQSEETAITYEVVNIESGENEESQETIIYEIADIEPGLSDNEQSGETPMTYEAVEIEVVEYPHPPVGLRYNLQIS